MLLCADNIKPLTIFTVVREVNTTKICTHETYYINLKRLLKIPYGFNHEVFSIEWIVDQAIR